MTLTEANHEITAIKNMLNHLVDEEVIDAQDARNLLPIVFQVRMKSEVLTEA